MTIDLSKLSDPFPAQDIEWRVSRAGTGGKGIYCCVLAYITARAIQSRLDEVCGTANWRTEEPRILTINEKSAFTVGISINDVGEGYDWITKWDVAEPTNIEPAKGGFSGAMKRAGAQWGIGRYLYHLDEAWAKVADRDPQTRGWNYAKLKTGEIYYWETPTLPGWALPKEPEREVGPAELNSLKQDWRSKFASESNDPADLRGGFERFVSSLCGDFPIADHTCWTSEALEKCQEHILATDDPDGVSPEVPFDSE